MSLNQGVGSLMRLSKQGKSTRVVRDIGIVGCSIR
jgi:hypothetical protein